MSTVKCPYCYRPIGTHNHDPIILPDGSPYKWSNGTTLISETDITQRYYKGFNQVNTDDILELQTELALIETNNSITPLTVFSSINSIGRFQITGYHIKELRDSVEKILLSFGLTKTDYFNYDEESQHIVHPNGDKIEWTDPITNATDLQKFQVKSIHMEDLRHYINIIWKETWVENPETETQDILSNSHTFIYPDSEVGGSLSFAFSNSSIASGSVIGDNDWVDSVTVLSYSMNDFVYPWDKTKPPYNDHYPRGYNTTVNTSFIKMPFNVVPQPIPPPTVPLTKTSVKVTFECIKNLLSVRDFGRFADGAEIQAELVHSAHIALRKRFKVRISDLSGIMDVSSTIPEASTEYSCFSSIQLKLDIVGAGQNDHTYTMKSIQLYQPQYEPGGQIGTQHITSIDNIISEVYETPEILLPGSTFIATRILLYFRSVITTINSAGLDTYMTGIMNARIVDWNIGTIEIIPIAEP